MSQSGSFSDFQALADRFVNDGIDVTHGRIMLGPALTYRGKAFAFHTVENEKGFRLGRDFDRATLPAGTVQLAPFKTRPPLSDWLIIAQPM